MFRNLFLCAAVLSIALVSACRQDDPTRIDSTLQPRDNRSVVNKSAENHSEMNHSASNAEMMNQNSAINAKKSNQNSTMNSEMKPVVETKPNSPNLTNRKY